MKYIIPLLVLAFVVTGFAYFTLLVEPRSNIEDNPLRTAPTTDTVESPDSTVRDTFSGEGSLYSLLNREDAIECAITYIPNPVEPEITGNIFTVNGDFRGDFVVPTPDLTGQMVTSIIIANGTIWQWTDIAGEIVGSTQVAQYDTRTLERLVAPVGFTNTVQYDCLTWPQVDRTIFEAPSEVLFTDEASADFETGVIYPEETGDF